MNEKIKALRTGRGETLEVFAKALGITVERIMILESGKELPNVNDLWKMSVICGVKMDYFLGDMI